MAGNSRILLAKMGLDCHDTGVITVAQQLREGGFEVIYLGLHNSADQVAKAALEEDVDLIGVSFLSGQHITQVGKLFDSLRARQLEIPVVCGGVIPDDDAKELLDMGVREVIRPGALTEDVLAGVRRSLAADDNPG
ncbi:MAG: cobalamin-dependent protein [Gammaproteobacteria bacterium]|nr:cobalamin-dependent protein [Gammaproteobacteria bacterium]